MKSFRAFALSAAFALLTAASAHADIDTESFTLTVNTGSLSGGSYTGSVSWDTTTNDPIAFITNFPLWNDAVANDGATIAELLDFVPTYPGIDLFFAPAPVDGTDAFAFGGDAFSYGETLVVDNLFLDEGVGTIAYGPVIDTTNPTPEPGSILLLASGLAGMAGTIRRKLKA